MGQEIEAKFVVHGDGWRAASKAVAIKQGYLSTKKRCTVRVRIKGDVDDPGAKALLTIKGAPDDDSGLVRREMEYAIPLDDARVMLDELCEGSVVEKTRHLVEHQGETWEVDEFHGDNAGLIFAELEADSVASLERVLAERKPAWIGEKLSEGRYTNAELAQRPFSRWSDAERARHR